MGLAGVDTLKQEKFSQGDLPNFDLEDVIEVSLSICVIVLLLKAHLSIIVELTGVQQVISWLDLDVVYGSKRVDESG